MNVYSVLLYRLSIYVTGSFNFLNNQTNIEVKNNLICFHLNNLPSILEPVMTYLIMDFLYNQMKNVEGKKMLFIDEAWTVLTKTNENSLLFRIIKTCRKHNMGVFLITQEAEDLLSNKAGRSLLTNSSTNILLRQKPNVINQLKEVFNLNEQEKYILLNSSVGSGIMIFNNEREQVTITASSEEHELNELKTVNKKEESNIPDKRYDNFYYAYKDLSNEEILYLTDKIGYVICDVIPINKIKSQKFLVKKTSRESPQHTFYVHHISDYLKQFTPQVWTYESVQPDIVFQIKGNKYALEIETGMSISHHKRIQEKSERLNIEYEDKWYFVVLDQRYNYFYKKYGKVLNRSMLTQKIKEIEGEHTPSINAKPVCFENTKKQGFNNLKPISMQNFEGGKKT